jgi:hypothetical protein
MPMRMYVLLIFAAIVLSFSTAYYAINLQNKTTAGTNEIEEIQKIKNEFSLDRRPLLEIDLSSMYPSRKYSQLLQAQNAFTRAAGNSKTYFSRPCDSKSERMSKLTTLKSEIWEDFRCNRITELPEKFFENSPLIHENGLSYAFLAYLSGRAPFYKSEWVRSNLNLFHINELEDLPAQGLEGNFKFLSKLQKMDLEAVVRGSPYILNDNYILIRNRQDYNVTYKIYSRDDFDNFLKEKIYYIRPFQPGKECFYREGRYCFEKDSGSLVHFLMQSSIFIFSGSVLVLFLVAVILFKKIRLQNFEEERKKHALRVLTHELRTPIANLLLQVEQINKHTEGIPPHALDEFLKMEGEVYRLKRLAEKSTSYLQSHDNTSLLALSMQTIPSINGLISDLVHDYIEKGVQIIPSKSDHSFYLDVYWFDICVKNLIENALYHGARPVKVKWSIDSEELILSVMDSGVCNYKNLDELISSDKSRKNSRGLGLGMNIVQKIMKEMGGKLIYSQNPTTFSLFLRNKK